MNILVCIRLVMTYFKINMSGDEKFTKYGTEVFQFNFILIIFIKAIELYQYTIICRIILHLKIYTLVNSFNEKLLCL